MSLDPRQRAMLAEMHSPVWWPQAEPEAEAPPVEAPAPRKSAPQSIAQVLDRTPELVASPAHSISAGSTNVTENTATLDWPAALASVWLNAAPGGPADWLVLGEALGIADDAARPFAVPDAPEAQLLGNMLHAVGITPARKEGAPSACITSVQKLRLDANADPVADSAPHLRRAVALLQPKVILALGPFAAQLLLQDSTPLGQMRGRVHRYHGVPVVVSYHPATLLRNRPEKAKAWADLCLALGVVA
ncbi:uracil-DNA glycosylase [Rhodoferax sp. WC2427]|uniref:uracil-DNA glycosylase n=1 Tax=Rhodoferax sp. WC2427 TaxID=3234144 RepID=UPI003467A63B